jgi:hypothetical protein
MNDPLNTRTSTKAASRAAMALSTLHFATDLFRCRLASKIVSNHPVSYSHPPLPNGGLRQHHRFHGAGHSPSVPTRRLFVHSH